MDGRQLDLLLPLVVPALGVDHRETREQGPDPGGLEGDPVHVEGRGGGLQDRLAHLARQEPLVDELVELILVGTQAPLQVLGAILQVRGPNGLVGVLGVAAAPVDVGLGGHVFRAVVGLDMLEGRRLGLLADADGVGADVGDEAHGALLTDVHALIELLGHLHGPLGGEIELPGRLLLQAGRGEGRRRVALLLAGLHVYGPERLTVDPLQDLLGLRLVAELLHVAPVGELGLKGLFALELGGDGPVLPGHELVDLLLPVADDPGGHGLDPSRGQSLSHLGPEDGADLIAHQPIEDPPGLLCVHQVHVDGPGLLEGALDGGGGDLVELDPALALLVQLQDLGKMPGDGLPLPVRVGGQVDLIHLLRFLTDGLQHVLPAPKGDILGLEAVLHVHAQLGLGQVPNVALAGHHLELAPQKLLYGLRLGGRLHDHQ